MLVMFLDESGDHNLDIIDPQYPVFVLGGCIMELEYHENHVTPSLARYKKDLFDTDNFILHTADLTRRRGIFGKLTNPEFRSRFYRRTNELMTSLDYQVVACAIKKEEHLSKYGLSAVDPYYLCLAVLVERFTYELRSQNQTQQGHIIAESRGEQLDNALRLAWIELRNSGTRFVSGSDIRKHISADLHIRKKSNNIAGLQLADLVVSPIGRHVLGKKHRQDWDVVRSKFRWGAGGRYAGYGLVVLPNR